MAIERSDSGDITEVTVEKRSNKYADAEENIDSDDETSIENSEKEYILAKEGKKSYQYICALVVSIGAIILGASYGWTSPGHKFLMDCEEIYDEPRFKVKKGERNWIAALVPLGALFGCTPGGIIADHFGRKRTLIFVTICGIGGWLLKTYATRVQILFAARFLLGIISGVYANVVPTYIVEIAEVSVRGMLGSLFELSINLGVLFVYVMGWFESYIVLGNSVGILSALYLIFLCLIDETPAYYVLHNKFDDAKKSMTKFRGLNYNVASELNELREQNETSSKEKFSFKIFTQKANLKGMFIAMSLVIIQQACGISAIVFFGEPIFEMAKVTSPSSCTVVLGTVQVIGTISSIFMVDHVGRKILMLISGIGMCVSLTVLGCYFSVTANSEWIPVITLVIYMIMYSLGFGPVGWLMLSEVLGPQIKKYTYGFIAGLNLLGASFVTFTFLPLKEALTNSGVFWLFAVLSALSVVFIIFALPETKDKTLQQIQDELAGKGSSKRSVNLSLNNQLL